MIFDVQEILAKRKANIDKLNNYLDAGKTPDEKIVKKTLQNIRRAEGQLIDAGFTDFDAVNDDGTFTPAKKDIPQNEVHVAATPHESAKIEEDEKSDVSHENSSASSTTETNYTYNNTEFVNESNDEKKAHDVATYNNTSSNEFESHDSISHTEENNEDESNNLVITEETELPSTSDNNYENLNDDTNVNMSTNTTTTSEHNETVSFDSNIDEFEKKSTTENRSKKKLFKIKKNRTEKLGVSIKKSNLNNISKLAKESGRTPNNVVNFMLESIYDEARENFDVEFAKKEEIKNTSYLIDERYTNAIDKIAKRTNLSKSDIFNILLETALEDYI